MCTTPEQQQCYCGAVTAERTCGSASTRDLSSGTERSFSCGTPCTKTLACGNHQCGRECHAGECPPCESDISRVTTCPCGHATLESLGVARTSCLDAIPTCGQMCSKPLACGLHACREPCHVGPCLPCNDEIPVTCRCGSVTKCVPCSTVHAKAFAQSLSLSSSSSSCSISLEPFELLCDKKCSIQRACGRHRCDVICCPLSNLEPQPGIPGKDGNMPAARTSAAQASAFASSLHTCPLICQRQLPCKRYTQHRINALARSLEQ